MKNEKDILRLFELLNNHEVFTPVGVVNDMLDLLPTEVFIDPYAKFLDPACKSGVFLREISYRLFEGLNINKIIEVSGIKYNLIKPKDRIDHILKNMIYGIATSEVTSYVSRRTLYGVMFANVDKSIKALDSFERNRDYEVNEEDLGKFVSLRKFNQYFNKDLFGADNASGNIFYSTEMVRDMIDSGVDVAIEDMAYPFIDEKFRNDKIKELLEMKFDVIIGNPPYQVSVGNEGKTSSKAKAIYHLFIDMSIKLKSKYISMITPSRWMTKTTEGIPDIWVDKMINSNKIKIIMDFENSKNCFPSVDIKGGVSYFLWDNNYNGKCKYLLNTNGVIKEMNRNLNELNVGIVIRNIDSLKIINKIEKIEGKYYIKVDNNFSYIVSAKDFFTNKIQLTSSWKGFKKNKGVDSNIKYYLNKRNHGLEYGWVSINDIPKNNIYININKVYIPAASGSGNDSQVLGTPFLGEKISVCSQTYLVVGFNLNLNINQCLNLLKYLKTKFLRYLVSIKKKTQSSPRGVYQFVPLQDFNEEWTDEKLYKKYNLNQEEIDYIESSIKEMK